MCVHVMSNLIHEYSRPFINSGPIITSEKFLNKKILIHCWEILHR